MASPMNVQGIYATAVVSDLEAALVWYQRFIGRPADDRPLPDMAQWRNMSATGGLQLWCDDARAGNAVMTIVVPDLDAEKERLSAHGILPETEARGAFGAVANFFDEENNRIVLAEPPQG
ncbi:VOC family protein [Rhizobium sp. 16-449-1b]|uniref:VOC family protein n=1 Tax=Rhizobium sp. 16-449-1b TaxID=2819989 RepID=UPI001ADB4C94|nr:VOC family protein [Rhizobium sp. 16-449-1b]MBO9198391.1 VOC family protein [Rhizobium sp. 16-449-1b]